MAGRGPKEGLSLSRCASADMFGSWLVTLVAASVASAAVATPLVSPLSRVLRFLPSRLPAGGCREALLRYLDALDGGADWALKFYDSSTKYPDGLLATNGYSLGHFDECVETNVKAFSGKYCLVNVKYFKANSSHPTLPETRFKVQRNEANLAICVPSVCKTQDLESALYEAHNLFPVLLDFHVHLQLGEDQCSVLEVSSSAEEPSVIIWLRYAVVVSALVYLYILFRRTEDSEKNSSKLLSCFSVSHHWKKLMNPCDAEDSIGCVHGLRVIALCTVIVGHRAEAISSSPLLNPEYIEKMFESPINIFVLNGTVVVDTFFTISGFLLCWKFLKSAERGSPLTSWKIILRRYLRLTPCYALVIVVQAIVMERLGNGPLWKMKVGKEAANCRTNWWANLLFINNYWDPQHICIDPSWYLACDMQLLLLGTMIIYAMIQWERWRLAPFVLALTASFWIPFYVTFSNSLDPTVIPDFATVGKTASNKTNLLLYITAYCRAGPYLIGIATSFLLDRLRKTQHWPPEVFWTRGWYLCAGCILGSVAAGYPFFTPLRVHPVLTALYAASFRTVFSLGIAFIIIAGACGRGVSFLSSAALLPLSRISYCVYLTHTLWIQLSYSWIRSPLYSTDLFQGCLILSDLIVCSFLGIVAYLFIESPASELCQLIQNKTRVTHRSQPTEVTSPKEVTSLESVLR